MKLFRLMTVMKQDITYQIRINFLGFNSQNIIAIR